MTFTQGHKQNIKHGIDSFAAHGDGRLQARQITRLSELRQLVESEPGRMDLRKELTARTMLIVELGYAHLRQQAEKGEDIWAGGVIRRLASYIAETRRLLDSFPGEGRYIDTELIKIQRVIDEHTSNGDR